MSNRAGHYVRENVRTELTARELEVLTLTAQGLTQPQIGALLWLSVETVKTHAKRTQRVLGATNAAHAVAIALTHGLIVLDLQET